VSVPPAATAIAVRNVTSAVASLIRLSPSRIVTIRRGTPSRRKIAVAATASGGATIAPSANAAGQPTPGTSAWTTAATTAAVTRTSATASNAIFRAFARMSRIDVK